MGTMLKKQWQRIVAAVLAIAMIINMTPVGALHAFAVVYIPEYTVAFVDQNGQPIEGVNVDLTFSNGHTESGVCDENGEFTCKSMSIEDAESVTITAICAHFETVSEKTVQLSEFTERRYEIVLNGEPHWIYFDANVASYGTLTEISGNVTPEGKFPYGENVTFKYEKNIYFENVAIYANDVLVTPDENGVYTVQASRDTWGVNVRRDGVALPPIVVEVDDTNSPQLEISVTGNTSDVVLYVLTTPPSGPEDFETLEPLEGTSYTATKNGIYFIVAVDEEGRVGSTLYEVTGFDETAPVIDAVEASTTELTNEKVTVTVTATDDTAMDRVVYSADPAANPAELTDTATIAEDKYVFEIDAAAGETNANTYYIWAIDAAGNVSDPATVQINIDKQAPAFTVTAATDTEPFTSGSWTGADKVTITATCDEAEATLVFAAENDVEKAQPYTAAIEVTDEGATTYFFWSKDALGNVSDPTEFTVKIDREKATISALQAAVADWANPVIKVTGEAADDGAGVGKVLYNSTEDFATAKEATYADGKFEFSVSMEEAIAAGLKYYVWAVDTVGVVSETYTADLKVDTTPADAGTPVADPAAWTKDNVVVTGTASDTESGVVKVVYNSTEDFDSAKDATLNDDGTYEFTVLNEQDFKGDYYVWAVDAMGNKSAAAKVLVQIDTTPADAGTPVANPATWTNGNVVVTGTASDNLSGVAKVVYNSTNDYNSAKTDVTLNADNTYQFTVTNAQEFNGSYYVWAVDATGNVSAVAEVLVQIDTTPADAGTPVADPATWTNSNVVVTGTASDDASNVAKVVYNSTNDFDSAVEATLNSDNTYEFTVPNAQEFNGSYYVWAVDFAGNVSAVKEVLVQIDTTDPEVPTLDAGANYNEENTWTNEDVVVTVTVEDADKGDLTSGINRIAYSTDSELSKDEVKELTTTDDLQDGVLKFTVTDFEFNGNYYVWAIDNAGNVSSAKAVKIKIDRTKPVVTGIFHGEEDITAVEGEDNFYYYGETIDVLAKHEDTNQNPDFVSKVAKLEYSLDGVDWKQATDITSVFPLADINEYYTVWAKVTDYAGNVSEPVATKLIVLDDEAPVDGTADQDNKAPAIQILHSGTSKNDIYNSNVTIQLSVIDPIVKDGNVVFPVADEKVEGGVLSGLKTIYYKVEATDIPSGEGHLTDEQPNIIASGSSVMQGDFIYKWTHTLTIDANVFNSNNVKVTVWAEDNAGNSTMDAENPDNNSIYLKIDSEKPTVNVDVPAEGAQNSSYFQGEKTATITVTERNFKADLIKVKVLTAPTVADMATTTTEYTDYELVWNPVTGKDNCDDTTNTATIKFPTDGHYKVIVESLEDEAGNVAETSGITYTGVAGDVFTIDTVNPVINVTYDNNAAVNDRYFAGFRTATVVITEHNIDLGKVTTTITASLNGAAIGAPAVVWSSSGDNHTATISYAADGDYTFDISAIDLAGRNNNNVIYSGAAPQSFTIDTTIEDPVISGVANGVAYKGSVIPSIAFTDVNYQTHTITLLRTRMNERNVNVTAELLGTATLTGQGFSLTAANFEEIRENDGIYTLTVTATDMAGNESTATVTFTVNRFGSVYVFSEYLSDLIADGGKYVPSVTEDLIVTEYNPDKLVENSLIIEISRDGKPVDGEFSVTPDINEYVALGESGWYQYRYTINKANFDKDGIYKISISSQDETGNYPEISNFEDMSIQFKVDSTAPEITSIVGLEEAIVNAQALDVKYTLFDAIALKSVKLYINGQLAEEINEFSDLNNFEGKFTLGESSSRQSVRLVVEDMAGNITDTSAESFESAFVFNPEVTVSTNVFVRWFANKPLFFGSIGGAVAAAAAIYYFIGKKKREDEEA